MFSSAMNAITNFTGAPTKPFFNPKFDGHVELNADVAFMIAGILGVPEEEVPTGASVLIWNPRWSTGGRAHVGIGLKGFGTKPPSRVVEGYTIDPTGQFWSKTGKEYAPTDTFKGVALKLKSLGEGAQTEQSIMAVMGEVDEAISAGKLPVFETIILGAMMENMMARIKEELAKLAEAAEAKLKEAEIPSKPADSGTGAPVQEENKGSCNCPIVGPDQIIVDRQVAAMDAIVMAIMATALPTNKDKGARLKALSDAKALLESHPLSEGQIGVLKGAMELVQPNSSKGVRLWTSPGEPELMA